MKYYYEVVFCWIKFHYYYTFKLIIEAYLTSNNIHKFALNS